MLTELANETLRVEGLDYYVESGTEMDEPIVVLYCRDRDRNRRTVEVEGFYPFFYITESEYEESKNQVESDYRVRYTEREKSTLHGEGLVKVTTITPSDVPELRDSFNETYEADVFFTNRFLITTGIKRGVAVPQGEERVHVDDITPTEDLFEQKPRVATIDIEVWAGGEFPEPTEAKNPITSASAHDSYTDEYYAWILEPDTWSGEQEWELPEGVDHCEINVYDSENEMLYDINNWIIDIEPDILTGWNSNDFDYPYYINRCQNINEWSYEDLADDVFVTKRGSAVINNVELFDMLEAYKKMQIHELDSNSLGNVSQEVLGYGKEDIHDLDEGWKHDPVLFLKYNIRDVQAVVEIEAHEDVDIINTYDNLRSVTGATYTECHHNLSMIDMLFLRQAHEKGIALPTNEKPDRGWYYGAFVYDPSPGLHKNVLYPDLKSLYPYIMWSLNVSPETVYDTLEDVRDDGYSDDDVYRAFVDRRNDEVKKETSPDEDELYYLKPDVKEGFVREVIDDIVEMKYEYSGTSKYGAIKRVTNCFTEDTEVMTPEGVVGIRDLSVGDLVYSYDMDTESVVVKPVTDTHEYPEYNGDVVTMENRNIDFAVTPNHDMVVKNENTSSNDDTYSKIEAGNLNDGTSYTLPSDWSFDHGESLNRVDVLDLIEFDEYEVFVEPYDHGRTFCAEIDLWPPRTRVNGETGYVLSKDEYESRMKRVDERADVRYVHCESGQKWVPRYYDGDDIVELFGWYITEGSTYTSTRKEYDDTVRGVSHTFSISQYPGSNHDSIGDLLDRMKLTYHEGDTEYTVCSEIFTLLLKELCGHYSENKMIPDMMFAVSEEQKELLYDIMMEGDGDGVRYTTKSDQLRDDMMELCIHLNRSPQYTKDGDIWRVYCSRSKNSLRMYRDGGTDTADGVYCVTVDGTNTLLAGRNGKFQFVGQSVYGVFGDSESWGKGFRLFDWRLGESITLAGRHILMYTGEKFIESLHQQGYDNAEIVAGDTDSVMTALPDADGMEESLDAAFEAAEYVNMSYDDFMCEKFWVCDPEMHKTEVEVESYADACFFLRDFKSNDPNKGVKKRYSQIIRWDEGDVIDDPSPKTKGFELVRSDVAQETKRVQKNVLDIVLTNNDNPKEEIESYLKERVEAIRSGDVSLEDIGVPSKINKRIEEYGEPMDAPKPRRPMPYIRGAKWAMQNVPGESPGSGSKPLYFPVARVGGTDLPIVYSADTPENEDEVDAIAVEDVRNIPEDVELDMDQIIEKNLKGPVNPILRTMQWSWDDLLADSSQTGLEAYM